MQVPTVADGQRANKTRMNKGTNGRDQRRRHRRLEEQSELASRRGVRKIERGERVSGRQGRSAWNHTPLSHGSRTSPFMCTHAQRRSARRGASVIHAADLLTARVVGVAGADTKVGVGVRDTRRRNRTNRVVTNASRRAPIKCGCDRGRFRASCERRRANTRAGGRQA